ncbi:hypothetical protein ACFX2G_030838 [Malus domestica]
MLARLDYHVVGQVAASAVSGEETPGDVNVVEIKTLNSCCVNEFEDVHAVFVLGRIPMLRRMAVVDGDDDGREFGGETFAEVVVGL